MLRITSFQLFLHRLKVDCSARGTPLIRQKLLGFMEVAILPAKDGLGFRRLIENHSALAISASHLPPADQRNLPNHRYGASFQLAEYQISEVGVEPAAGRHQFARQSSHFFATCGWPIAPNCGI